MYVRDTQHGRAEKQQASTKHPARTAFPDESRFRQCAGKRESKETTQQVVSSCRCGVPLQCLLQTVNNAPVGWDPTKSEPTAAEAVSWATRQGMRRG